MKCLQSKINWEVMMAAEKYSKTIFIYNNMTLCHMRVLLVSKKTETPTKRLAKP